MCRASDSKVCYVLVCSKPGYSALVYPKLVRYAPVYPRLVHHTLVYSSADIMYRAYIIYWYTKCHPRFGTRKLRTIPEHVPVHARTWKTRGILKEGFRRGTRNVPPRLCSGSVWDRYSSGKNQGKLRTDPPQLTLAHASLGLRTKKENCELRSVSDNQAVFGFPSWSNQDSLPVGTLRS